MAYVKIQEAVNKKNTHDELYGTFFAKVRPFFIGQIYFFFNFFFDKNGFSLQTAQISCGDISAPGGRQMPAQKIPCQTLAAAPARSCELKFRETAVFVFFCMINRLAHDL
jgi:hypothetical protein